jgi:mono/diheme cytochrome c family protein/glucose/arabinose dehydrogenase
MRTAKHCLPLCTLALPLEIGLITWKAAAASISPALSPDEELKFFQLTAGLRIELVACEPMVQDPVAMTFDERGRLWVVEMRGFMPNLDRKGEDQKVGRVSILEDTDGDGRMDKSTVFLDRLVLPRAVAIVRGGALIAEHKPLWFAEDTNGDGKADRKKLIDAEYGGSGLPEHSGNGLWRGLDNWHYNAKSRWRYRWRGGQWLREETESRGQWGICHDDWGRRFYNYNWSQLHADLVPPNYLSRNPHHSPSTGISVGVATNQTVFPARPTPAINRAYLPGVLDEEGRTREFTSAGAPLIYRGDALPVAFRSNAFVVEPAANLVKRNLVQDDGLGLTARPAETNREFLASTDERFRPVFLADGPDGALYVVDMYRGVIQHGAYMTPYLRDQSQKRGLAQPVHRGRIWRIVAADAPRRPPVRLEIANGTELIAHLSHPNGWVRDTAQRLLVERGDRLLVPQLREIALHGNNPLGRVHALWTLEALGESAPNQLAGALRDSHPKVVANALRVLEGSLTNSPATLYPSNGERDGVRGNLLSHLEQLARSTSPEVVLQNALTAGNTHGEGKLLLLAGIISRHVDLPLMRDAVMSGLRNDEFTLLQQLWRDPEWQQESLARAGFLESLASAVVRSSEREQIQSLLALMDRPPQIFGWREQALLAGVAVHAGRRDFKPITLKRQPELLTHAVRFPDRAVRSRIEKLPQMFTWPGHAPQKFTRGKARPLQPREEELFTKGRQIYLTVCAGCHGPDGAGLEPQAPPLLDSEWVLGSEAQLVRILLHGLEGAISVNGTRYEPPRTLAEMPSLAVLDNESLAAVLTYIRREWGHTAEPVSTLTVARTRTQSQGRGRPWTEKELRELTSKE